MLNKLSLNALSVVMLVVGGSAGAKAQSITQVYPGSSDPATEWSVIATRSVKLYSTSDMATASIVGTIAAGETHCIEFDTTTGPGAMVDIFDRNGDRITQGWAANDGSFRPTAGTHDIGPCEYPADSFISQGQSLQQVQATQAAANAPSVGQEISNWNFWAIGLYTATGLVMFWGLMAFTKTQKTRPLPESVTNLLYQGFVVNPGDFIEDEGSGQQYRVNSTGKKINLKGWEFDEKTGEFQRLLGKRFGSLVVERKGYTERFEEGHKLRFMMWVGFFTLAVLAAAGLLLPEPYSAIWVFLFGVMFAVGLRRAGRGELGETFLLGPQPLTRRTDDFGPSTATAPASHPAQDDLTYRPPSDDLGYTPST